MTQRITPVGREDDRVGVDRDVSILFSLASATQSPLFEEKKEC